MVQVPAGLKHGVQSLHFDLWQRAADPAQTSDSLPASALALAGTSVYHLTTLSLKSGPSLH